jgi:GT2 family glycosyltransferase
MQKITFVLPSRNNLEFLKLAYQSIRNLQTNHEVLILDDASEDGTSEWIVSLQDPDVIHYHNPGPERIGIVGMFDKGIEMARTDIIFAFHADMVAAPNLDANILKHLKPGVVVSATRVEPPLHPAGPEKITVDFGVEADQFDFDKWNTNSINLMQDKTTDGIFAPWCMYKTDYLAIGGHDPLFAPQSKEDSDLFNRFVLNGYRTLQSWDGLVYHFTSRGSRFNKYAGGGAGKDSPEWQYTTNKNARNFIRKWGHFVKHTALMQPIIPSKYGIAFRVESCTQQLLQTLEPWCDRIYSDAEWMKYIILEQPNTIIDLRKRCHSLTDTDRYDYDDIIVEIDGNRLTQQDFVYIQQLAEILDASDLLNEFAQPGEQFELGNLTITIMNVQPREKDLIVCKK